MTDLYGFGKCEKPDCMRKVKPGVLYCCSPCADAGEGKYEIDSHNAACDQRSAARGEFSVGGQA